MNVEQDNDRLVDAYLKELAKAAEALPAARRTELIDDMRAHIAEERAAGASSESEIRQVLQRLGDPQEIVAAATEGLVLVEVPPKLRPSEMVALALVFFGPYLPGIWVPLIAYMIGIGMLWSSNRWTVGWKLLGTLNWPLAYAVLLGMEVTVQPPWALSLTVDILIGVALLVGMVLAAKAPAKVQPAGQAS
ncbi:HAAS signaling domain-containing protein [Kribbella sp. C-35]|uniref:HAAS signaling domain-containing protein n=1 Tax=Kribbella sp. C-35 TaxID=2789276 RepID=UPI00397ACA21